MTYLPWLIALPVILLLLWLAWRRPNRQRLSWRLLASAVASISLVLLVFPPATQQAISPGTAILLTEGYNSDTLDALLQELDAKPQVYTYNTSSNADALPLASLHNLRQQQPGLQTLHLLGYGLEEAELQQLQNLHVLPHLTPAPAGVQIVSWPQRINLGEAVEVTGKYKAAGKNQVKLYLHAGGKAQDSIEVQADSTATFRLRYTPKLSGRFTYTLVSKADEQRDTLGQVPVQVIPQQPLGVLLLASSPNFEFKFLKNHLAQQQHKVALRTSISKDLGQSEWLNMPRTDLSRITSKLLQNFDVVITEPEALQNLSASERNALQQAVTENGLGVLTIASAPPASRTTAFFTGFQTKRLSQQDTRRTRASWATNSTADAMAAPYALVPTTAVKSLVTEQENSFLAGVKRAGWGKVAISFVPQTFPWQLEGKDATYASYWASLLSAVAKEEVRERFWQVTQPQAPHPSKPVILAFTDYTLAANAAVPTATVTSLTDSASINLPLAQNLHQPEQFSGTFWPRRSGWHQVQTAGAAPFYFFVQDSAAWEFESIAARKAAVESFVAQQSINPADTAVAFKDEPMSLIWFFLLFVLSSGFLWLEEKL
ncbi:hypothetical protein [Pontibacter akesuensis]|uniref:N-terminal double-transmembrane domain-containing protein n=1 Tax=Pontibacter akesuensis TaxID=388950 RepID=A0A1I7I700_9BACT|nr:hypothetical protein [Pontibacter akesuensis]GHA65548.1 hypothetical protein GCM10007389_18040 [Pontibacter akesuensis]SFU68742.1 hypothetical protein SAMN04487941_1971 [Pontibacter akesuensis]